MRGGVGHARDQRPESTTRGPPQEVFGPDGAPDVVDPSVRRFSLRCCGSRPASRRAVTPGNGTGRRRPAPTASRARLRGPPPGRRRQLPAGAQRRIRRAGDTLVALTGVFSGSLSFLFNAYDGKVPFSSLLAEARARGYTEPDPRADLSGRDVARKLLIVARAAGERLEERDIEVEDLVPAPLREVALEAFLGRLGELDPLFEHCRYAAAASGQVLRYVARVGTGRRASVRLEALPPDHPCAQLSGADNLFAFTTRRYHLQPLVVRGPGAGPEVTAQALLADVLEIVA